MEKYIEAAKQGLKYAFAAAAICEAGEMLTKASYHIQPLDRLEVGVVIGVALGVFAYVDDTHDQVTVSAEDERRQAETIEQSGGKVVGLTWRSENRHLNHP